MDKVQHCEEECLSVWDFVISPRVIGHLLDFFIEDFTQQSERRVLEMPFFNCKRLLSEPQVTFEGYGQVVEPVIENRAGPC